MDKKYSENDLSIVGWTIGFMFVGLVGVKGLVYFLSKRRRRSEVLITKG